MWIFWVRELGSICFVQRSITSLTGIISVPEPHRKMGSLAFSENLIRQTGITLSPGVGFGPYGEGFVRMALVTHDNRFHDALLRIKKFLVPEKPKQAVKNKS